MNTKTQLELIHEGLRGRIIAEILSLFHHGHDLKLRNAVVMFDNDDANSNTVIEELTLRDRGNAEFMAVCYTAGQEDGEYPPGELSTEMLLAILSEVSEQTEELPQQERKGSFASPDNSHNIPKLKRKE